MNKLRSVNPSFYNKVYFKGINFGKVDPRKTSTYPKKYLEILNICPIKSTDKIVDFGCGNGLLSLILAYKKNIEVIGIDYSKDAITNSIAAQLDFQKTLGRTLKLKYLQRDNLHLPMLKNISIVYLSDVVEHLYDEELTYIFNIFKTWGKKITIIIHTDNSYYLKFVKPIQDILALITRKTSINKILYANNLNAKYHINLTNPQKFNKLMFLNGYKNIQIIYPQTTKEAIIQQMGQLSNIPGAYWLIQRILKIDIFKQLLSPGFYAVYEHKNIKKTVS